MSTSEVVTRVSRRPGTMVHRELGYKLSVGGRAAVMRMVRGLKRAASSARRRLERKLVDPRNYED